MRTAGRGRALALALFCSLWLASGCYRGPTAAGSSVEPQTIAFLRAVPDTPSTEPTFMDELRLGGFVEGRNLIVLAGDYGEAYPDPEEARQAVAGWAAQGADLVIALSSSGAAAARDAAPELNVIFLSNDPTATGLIENEQAPEGRLTGVTFRVPADRTLDLARRAVPDLEVVGLAYPPEDPAAIAHRDAVNLAAEELGIALATETFEEAQDLPAAVERLADQGTDALLVSTSPTATRALEETRIAAEEHGIPVIANTSLATWALVSLFPDAGELGRQMGRQAARLLSGSSPGSVPVEDPRRFVITINAGVARDLGFELPDGVLREANTVIDP